MSKDLVKYFNFAETDWVKKSAQAFPHLCYPWIYAATLGPTSITDPKYQACVCLFKDGILTVHWNSTVMKDARDRFFDKLKANSNYLEELKTEYYQIVEKYLSILELFETKDLSTLSDQELTELYDQFYEAYVNEFKYFLVLGEAVSHQSVDFAEPVFRKKLGNNFDKVFPILTHPSKPSFLDEENSDREKLVEEYKKTQIFDDQSLLDHAKKYFYVKSNYANGKKLTVEELKTEIVKEAESEVTPTTEEFEAKESYIEKYNLDDYEKLLLKIVDEFFKLIDDRKKFMMMASYYQITFLEELARRTQIPFETLENCIQPEYKDILAGRLEAEQLQLRNSKVCILLEEGKPLVFTGSDFDELNNYFESKDKSDIDIKEVKGSVASKGNVTGTVKVVLRAEDISKVEIGDILVASMTRPEMIPAMKLAAAFVTNEGGITCHAAIIAREMKKPCVISTKIATEVFKDGDMVEVDANNGIVKLINL